MPVHSKFESSDNKPKYFCYSFESFPENTATRCVVNDHSEWDGWPYLWSHTYFLGTGIMCLKCWKWRWCWKDSFQMSGMPHYSEQQLFLFSLSKLLCLTEILSMSPTLYFLAHSTESYLRSLHTEKEFCSCANTQISKEVCEIWKVFFLFGLVLAACFVVFRAKGTKTIVFTYKCVPLKHNHLAVQRWVL